nr:MAG TPA: Neurohypophysial hormone [Caudoviricetes sp.]
MKCFIRSCPLRSLIVAGVLKTPAQYHYWGQTISRSIIKIDPLRLAD